ncbi:MAG: protease HtpX [Candidatus Aenigmarchaeota archaeon ex4484_56]|nr:MAG: protease HtpX [Candidatus Aenigmarchaeota archaeon ex4484_56]
MLRTVLLLGFLTSIFLGAGFLIAGTFGMTVAFIIAVFFNLFSYWYSDKIVLSMYRAKPVKNKEIDNIVEELAEKAKIKKPKLYIVDTKIPNAFATGRNPDNSAIAVTKGLIEELDKDEIEGVLAHEISHIKNRDILISTIAATIGGAISYLVNIAWWSIFAGDRDNNILLLPLLLLAPLSATIVQLAISRAREYHADYSAGIITRKPLSLASALRKIENFANSYKIRGNHATSHMFIVNPFRGDSLSKLFSTHPPTYERIKKLEELNKKI